MTTRRAGLPGLTIMTRALRIVTLAALLAGIAGGAPARARQAPPPAPAPPQQLTRTEDAVVALFSLQTELEVDGKMLRRMEARVADNARARADAREKVDRLYADLDDLWTRYLAAMHGKPQKGDDTGEGDPVARLQELVEAKELEVMAAERAEAGLSDEGQKLRSDLRTLKERMTLLSAQIDALHAALPPARESVSGVWDITMMPAGDKGTFALFQSGTVVTGQYVLAGPFQGSLDGTLIDRKLLLHRIDSRLGRSMDFSATLSQDGQSLRGTWENYDLANGQARTGAWAGRRRPPRRALEEGEGGEEGGPQE